MIKKAGFDQSFLSSVDFQAPVGKTAPDPPPSGVAGYTDSLETASTSMFDFSPKGNPSSDRSIIVVGGKTDAASDRSIIVVGGKTSHGPEITLGSGDGIQLQDANFEGAHSSMSGEIGTNSLSFKNITGDVVDGAGDVVDWVGDAASDLGYEITHPGDWVGDAMYYGSKAWGAIDDAASAVGEFFQDTPVSDTTEWLGDRAEDAGDLLITATNELYYGLNEAGLAIGDLFKETPVPDIFDAAGDAFNDFSAFTYNLFADPVGTTGDAIDSAGGFIGDIISDTGDAAGDAANTAGAVFQGAIQATGDAAGDVIDTIGGAVEDVGDWVGNAVDDLF